MSTFIIYDHLKASRHAFDEFAAIFKSYPKCPNFFYHIFQLLQIAGLFFSHLVFQYYPQIFNRIEVRTVAGPIKNLNFFTFKKLLTIFALWHGAPSCMKIVHSCEAVTCFLAIQDILRRLWLSYAGVRKKSPAVPLTGMTPHIMIFGECFIVCYMYFSSNRFPTGLQTECFRDPNCWMHDSSEKNHP